MVDVSLKGRALLWAVVAISIGVSLSAIDGIIVNIGLPIIAEEFQVSASRSVLAVNAYQIVAAMSLLPFATLGDKIGYRRIYLGGLVFFILSSLACGLAQSFDQLVAARAAQGFGAAAVMCVGTALVRTVYPMEKLGRGVGINAMVVASSTALGPTLASLILSVADWRWFFLINIPFGLLGLFLGWRTLPMNPLQTGRYDVPSAVLSALTIGSMLLFAEGLGHGQSLLFLIFPFTALVVIGIVFIRRQLRLTFPIMPVDLIRQRPFALSVAAGLCSFAAQLSAVVSIPFFLTFHTGIELATVGLIYSAWPLSIMCIAGIAGHLSDRIHPALLGWFGLTLSSLGFLLLATIPADSSMFDMVWRMALCGLGFGLFQSPNTRFVIGLTPRNRTGSVSGLIGTIRLTGQTFGASIAAFMLYLFADDHGQSALFVATVLAFIAALFSLARKNTAYKKT